MCSFGEKGSFTASRELQMNHWCFRQGNLGSSWRLHASIVSCKSSTSFKELLEVVACQYGALTRHVAICFWFGLDFAMHAKMLASRRGASFLPIQHPFVYMSHLLSCSVSTALQIAQIEKSKSETLSHQTKQFIFLCPYFEIGCCVWFPPDCPELPPYLSPIVSRCVCICFGHLFLLVSLCLFPVVSSLSPYSSPYLSLYLFPYLFPRSPCLSRYCYLSPHVSLLSCLTCVFAVFKVLSRIGSSFVFLLVFLLVLVLALIPDFGPKSSSNNSIFGISFGPRHFGLGLPS